MFYGIQVWALGRPLQDLDVRALEESRHLVRFMARSIVLLEDKCFTLAIKWRSWWQHVVPQHPHVLVLSHGASHCWIVQFIWRRAKSSQLLMVAGRNNEFRRFLIVEEDTVTPSDSALTPSSVAVMGMWGDDRWGYVGRVPGLVVPTSY